MSTPSLHHKLTRRVVSTPLGDMIGITSDSGIILFSFASSAFLSRDITNLFKHLPSNSPADIVDGDHSLLSQLESEIGEYFAGLRRDFSVPLHLVGSAFNLSVWNVLLQIPYGTTCSYAEEARLLGRPTAVRAVANANGRNPLSILTPCHRVVSSGGTLGGYSSGIELKIELLRIEGILMVQSGAKK